METSYTLLVTAWKIIKVRDHLESLKLDGLNKGVVFSWRYFDIFLTNLDSYFFTKFGWSLFTGGLCSKVVTIMK